MVAKWETLWNDIEQAGSMEKYVRQQLEAKGFLVQRRATDNMSVRELETYKKQLKQEALEQRQLKKQAWQAYKATHIVHLGTGIYWSDDGSEDRWDLLDAEKRLVDNQLPHFKDAKQLATALQLSISQLRTLCYHRDAATTSHYQHFTIAKRQGGERAIWAPKPQLKQAQRWVLHQILDQVLIHGAAHGFIAGRSIASNAAEHNNSDIIIKLDLKDFFPSISWRRVKGIFRKIGYREQIATLLALLCSEAPRQIVQQQGQQYYVSLGERCLPQGAPTSPALTNILCLSLDRRLTSLANKHGWRYSRYADDLTFSLPQQQVSTCTISHLLGAISAIISNEGLQLNSKKTRIIRQGMCQQVTGLVVNDDLAPRVSRQLKRQMRAAIHNLQQGKGLAEGQTLERLRGYAAYIAMTDQQLGKKLLNQLSHF